jgi:glycosyltransferase involved in cell wall biosynthesis
MENSNLEEILRMEPKSNLGKTLTICIPTRNRSKLLTRCLELIIPTLIQNKDVISLLIIDNNSIDETQEVVANWIEANSQFDVTYIRKTSNSGALDSILLGLNSASTTYFMFIGDDDTLIPDGIARLIEILKANPNLGILVEAEIIRGSNPIVIEEISVAVQQRKRFSSQTLFYRFGNAWAGIYNVRAMQTALRDPSIRKKVLASVWGQAELGFIATAREGLKVGSIMFKYGHPHSPNPFNPGGLTSILSASHLISSSIHVSESSPALSSLTIQLGDKLCSPVPQHLIAILRTWPKTPKAEFTKAFQIFSESIVKNFTFRESFWARLLHFASYFPNLIMITNLVLDMRLSRAKQRSDSNINYHDPGED